MVIKAGVEVEAAEAAVVGAAAVEGVAAVEVAATVLTKEEFMLVIIPLKIGPPYHKNNSKRFWIFESKRRNVIHPKLKRNLKRKSQLTTILVVSLDEMKVARKIKRERRLASRKKASEMSPGGRVK